MRPVPANPTSTPPPALDTLPTIDRCGRYELLGRLGMGGMAEIFLAREPMGAGQARYVVVKRILEHISDEEAFVQMFLDEARLAMRLRHPHICPVYELGQDGDDWFLAMEWVHGITLRELQHRMSRMGTHMPVAMAVRIVSDLAGALHYAHRLKDDSGNPLGIVHRDVSPHNVMISFDGAVKLLDFGIAKAMSQSSRTRTGQLKGKLGYMAPEQCMQIDVDARTDVFALGIVLYECLTGRPLFKGDSEINTMRNVLEHEQAPSVRKRRPDVPAALDEVVRRALAPKPRERYQSAGEMQRALEQVLVSKGEVVQDTQLAEWLGHVFAKEIRRGPRLKKPRRERKKRRGTSTASQSMSGVISSSYTATSGLSEAQLAVVAHQADEEAAALAKSHARKLVLLGLLFVLVVGGVFYVVGREAFVEPSEPAFEATDAPEPDPSRAPATEPPVEREPREEAPAPRFRVVLPEGE